MYKNIFHLIGRKWITREQIELVLNEFPEDSYSVYVLFADKSTKALTDCTGSETNIDSIYIGYRDGSLSVDREPYRFIVTRPFDAGFFLTLGIKEYFIKRSKDKELYPQTRNEDPDFEERIRCAVMTKFLGYVHMNGVDPQGVKSKVVRIPVNCFDPEGRSNLLRFLANLDNDGIQTFIDVHFDHATIDQLQRLDTMMEFGDIADVLKMAGE